ncbi:MAG: thymidine phosphorylase [Elusimicrobia bacterium]|nr:thymidine phosphorylase [Elusimicrobiota bacterium]
MRMLDMIAKKRDGFEHAPEEIAFIVRSAALSEVPDYQLSAWLMAAWLKGMTRGETVALTRAMARSGKTLKLSALRAPKVDKHSTGGVGDGISIPLAPLLAAAGLAVPMMSGRGLGHTGGTLDKLEAIPGFKVRIPIPAVERQVKRIGVCMFGQSWDLAPADGKLYSLRDATATVESRPLIVASILSKKLAEDLNGLIMDVKCGSGAFFKDPEQAEGLASDLVRTACGAGLNCVAVMTDMEQPLGLAVGNALEIRQAVSILQGDFAASDYAEVLFTLGGWMLVLGRLERDWRKGAEKLKALIRTGKPLARFKDMVKAQGGDARVADDPEKFLPRPKLRQELKARSEGHLVRLDAKLIGRAAVALGAGRDRQEDAIDFSAGFILRRKLGDSLRRADVIAEVYASDAQRLREGLRMAEEAVGIGRARPKPRKTILKVIK